MKIYFAGSIRGEKPDLTWFYTIIEHISRHGKVLTEHSFGESPKDKVLLDDQQIYERDIAWLREADAIIAEVTAPSLGVGYEIAKAEEWGKPVLLLCRYLEGRKPSAMLKGNKDLPMVIFKDENTALEAADEFLSKVEIRRKMAQNQRSSISTRR